MGTGVVSIALAWDGSGALSRILLAAAASAWVSLGLLLVVGALHDWPRVRRDACTPAALSGVAASAVLGARLTVLGWPRAGEALLAVACALWCALLVPVFAHWVTPTVGGSLMVAVSTESLAVLSAMVAEEANDTWLLTAALAPLALGLAFYAFVMARFDRRQLAIGQGDHWVTGGAAAISALAAGHIALAADRLHALGELHAALRAVAVAAWIIALAWLPILLGAELRHPRLRYDVRRWSTVFPIGMYAACSYVVGSTVAVPAITAFARVVTWAAFAAWLAVTVAMVRHGLERRRHRRPRGDCRSRRRAATS